MDYEINFINCTKDECLQFAKKVENDEIEEEKLESIFDDYTYYKDDYSEEDVIYIFQSKNNLLFPPFFESSKITLNGFMKH